MTNGENKNLVARFADDLGQRLSDPVRVLTILASGGLVVMAAYSLIQVLSGNWSVLHHLRDQDYARGLITLVITFVSLALAVILVLAVLTRKIEEGSFRSAREVFGVLAGILGTIVGFYFGTSDKQELPLKIAGMRLQPGQVRAVVTGGKPGYRYTLTVDGTVRIQSKESKDGYVEETMPEVKAGQSVRLQVRDAADSSDEINGTVPDDPPSPAPTPSSPESAAPPSSTLAPAQ
jgi:hypothetical protein